ncbi:MAG: SRPBCC domain-containing protein [Solirubrobacterales bacterium]
MSEPSESAVEPLTIDFTVDCLPEHAFAVWTEKAGAWWPSDHTISKEKGTTLVFEPRLGGRIYERTPSGAEHDWGEVSSWEPPHRLAYSWHMTTGVQNPTEVEITFTAAGAATSVQISHRGWERFGAEADKRRARNRWGWEDLLPSYRRACTA